ncbi:MAG: metal ABC transporter solute-binding protein, Zn/Mn family [Planctomycetota bacterium]|jgi:zinc transport system substrate-binding protein
MKRTRLLLSLVFIAGLAGSCGRCDEERDNDGKLLVFVGILPLADFVERIGGDRVAIEVLVPPGQSPATYEPTPRQMARLGEGAVLFRTGSPFESRFVEKLKSVHGKLPLVDLREGIELMEMGDEHCHHEGEHGEESCSEDLTDPHIWLDPIRAKTMAAHICETLKNLAPEHEKEFKARLAEFVKELDMIHDRISKILAPLKGREIFVFHPAYGYFAKRYGLEQVAVETGGKEPGPKRLANLIEMARERRVKVVFVQPQFSRKSAEAVAKAIGGAVVPMDPLARDYLRNLEAMATQVEKGLR